MNKKLIIILFFFSTMFLFSQRINVSAGNIEVYENFPSKYVTPRNVSVWLPENFYPKKKYTVLYMHDGQMLFDANTTWNKQEWGVDECLTELTRAGKIRNVIVVGIWNSESHRHPEYFPQKPYDSLTIDDKQKITESLQKAGRINEEFKPFSDAYLKFIVEELKPFIDKTYPTLKEMQYTFTAGSSMGGLISMYAVCEYPDVFGGAACLSTHWPGTFETDNNPIPDAFYSYLKKNLPDPKTHRFYFDYGTETLDEIYEPYQKKVDVILKEKGYISENWVTKKFEGANHSEAAWRMRLAIPMEFLFHK
jgi:enterochelin esterase-like enzyme